VGYKYKVNHEYFDKIDSEYKAYMLGLIYADGSVKQPKGNRQMRLDIALQEEDGYILDKFSDEVCGGAKYLLNPLSVSSRGWKKRAFVYITSNNLCQKLIDLGCNIRKSIIGMQFPDIDKKYHKDFIRGFMDGDGSVIIKKVNYKYIRKTSGKRKDTHIQQYILRIAFSSTDKIFLLKVAELLNITKPYIASRMRHQLVYTLWIENKGEAERVLNYLYKDANYFLTRKYDKLLEFNKTIKSQAESILSEGLETT
jgi:LAGLIDADG endonuclease